MKFVELKQNLKTKVDSVYLLEGDDRYCLHGAIELIEKQLNLSMPDLNMQIFDEGKFTLTEVLDAASVFPFGDEKRLIVVWNYGTGKDAKLLEDYIKSGSHCCVIVFVSSQPNDFTKKIKPIVTYVDCNKLDDVVLYKWIINFVGKNGKKIEEGAVKTLIRYCNNNLSKINSEAGKLCTMDGEVITGQMVQLYVVPDKEYQIYELTDAIAKRDRARAFDIVGTMLERDKNFVGVVQYLYGSFRKLFYIALSKDSDDELAQKFNCKPYAIKMSRQQARLFSPKQLKRINSELSSEEFLIKTGNANQKIATDYILSKIFIENT